MARVRAGASLRAAWRGLAAEQRRWIYVNALLVTALINLALNAGIARLSVIGEARIPLWSIPLIDRPSTVTDTVGTFFFLPLITTLLCTTAVWRDLRLGNLPPLGWSSVVGLVRAYLPRTRMARGIVFGILCTAALAPLAVLVLVALDLGDLTVGQFVLYKAALGVGLGVLVTPAIALCAMASSPHSDSSPSSEKQAAT